MAEKFSYNDIKNYIEVDSQSNCKLLTSIDEYNDNSYNTTINLKILCGICNKIEYETSFNKFKHRKKRQCNECGGRKNNAIKGQYKRLSYSEIENYINGIEGNDCILQTTKEEYKKLKMTTNSKLKIKCKCGVIFKAKYLKFKYSYKRQCNECNVSRGEKEVIIYLKTNDINYETQYIFNDLKDKDYLKFDFAIFNNNNLKFLIEYDGEYHYYPITGELELRSQQKRDKMKNDYCLSNGIKLIRIPFWQFDKLEQILDKWLK